MSDGPKLSNASLQFSAYLASLLSLGRLRLALIAMLVLAGGLVEGVGIILLIPLLDLAFASGGSGTPGWLRQVLKPVMSDRTDSLQIGILIGGFVAVMIVRSIVVWQRDIRLATFSAELVDRWRARIVNAVAGASWRRLQELRHSRLDFAVNGEVARLSVGSDQLLNGAVAVLQLSIQIVFALYLAPLLCLIALGGAALGLPLLLPLLRRAHRHGTELTRDGAGRQHIFHEFLAGMKLAKAQDAETRYVAEHNARSAALRSRALAFFDVQLRSHNAFQLVAAMAGAAIMFIGLTQTHTPPTVLSAVLVLLARIAGPAQQLVRGSQAVLTMLPAVGGLIALENQLGATKLPLTPTGPCGTGPARLAFSDLGYRVPGRDAPILENVAGMIEPGELVVLSGRSGAGKTTLVDILLGLVEPDGGELVFDGTPVTTHAERALMRRQVAYVPQEPFLFDRTLRENLSWVKPDAAESELWHALSLAEADGFVRAWPQGLDTRVGDRGATLSGGERQRICLARALLGNPRLLILDEATSALDRDTEDRLLETLARLRGTVTILMITHRLPSSLRVDRRLRLEGGRLVAELQ